MSDRAVARNYAEALFAVGERAGQTERFASVLEALAGAIAADERVQLMLESPRVPKRVKTEVLQRALARHAPELFLRWVTAVVRRRRQGLMGAISREYGSLVDVKFNRVHAGITVARPVEQSLREEIRRRLSASLGKEVVPHFREDAAILGGVIIRVGDRVIDGSVRHKLASLRRQMLGV
ncbi:MAG: ATP synthase F1 subunit delta [Gemmatimonadota bacterium]|nr:ATP synthase F1 subunit delta [Gemmatimonadota bacterium]